MNQCLTILKWLDNNVERLIMIIAYSLMSAIIFVEVIRRMLFGLQSSWSVQVPIYLFLILTWFGASYNAKMREHLRFEAFRAKMSPRWQYVCAVADYICWVFLGVFVIYFTIEQVQINRDNFSMVLGTEIMSWYFLSATPIGWMLLMYRVTQNLMDDTRKFRRNEPLIVVATQEEGEAL